MFTCKLLNLQSWRNWDIVYNCRQLISNWDSCENTEFYPKSIWGKHVNSREKSSRLDRDPATFQLRGASSWVAVWFMQLGQTSFTEQVQSVHFHCCKFQGQHACSTKGETHWGQIIFQLSDILSLFPNEQASGEQNCQAIVVAHFGSGHGHIIFLWTGLSVMVECFHNI